MTSKTKTIKDRILEEISRHIDQQNAKGIKEYGHTLEDCPADKYDWRDMMIDELIDALQYAHKRNMELEKRLAELEERFQREVNKAFTYGR